MLNVGPVAVAFVVELVVADATVVADYQQRDAKLEMDGLPIVADDVKVAAGVAVGVAFVAVVDAAAFAERIEFDFAGRSSYDAVASAAVAAEDVVTVAGAAQLLQVDVEELERHDGVAVTALFVVDSASVASYLIRPACSCR